MPALASVPPILLGGPVPLDLVNTRLYLADEWVDLLDHAEHRAEWLTAVAGRLGIGATRSSAGRPEVAAAIRDVREHVAAAVEPARRGERPPARALSGLNDALRAAPAVPRVRWDGSGVVAGTVRVGPVATRLAAGLAEAAVTLLADPAIREVRRCEAPGCVVVFLPRNSRRRWCTPTVCGNRARVARYYRRRRDDAVMSLAGQAGTGQATPVEWTGQ